MTFEELQKIVYDAGIVGAGGAGFPTHRKFSDKVKQIIVNAAECEPLMMVDHHILEHHLQALVDTLNVLIDTMGADEAIIGIKGKNMHLLDTKIVASLEGTKVRIKEIPDIYPAGDEVVLTYETTGKIQEDIRSGDKTYKSLTDNVLDTIKTVISNSYPAVNQAVMTKAVTEKYHEVIGTCPLCGGNVIEGTRGFG